MPPKTDGPSPPRRRRKLAWALALTAPFVLLAGALAAVVATPWGLRTARPLIADAIATAVEGSAEIDGLEGTLWHGFRAGRIEVAGADGLAVRIDDLRLDWTPTDLLQRVLRIDVLTADRVALTLPAGGEAKEPSEPFALPQLPVAVRLGRLDVAELAFRPEPGAAAKRLTLAGDLRLSRRVGGTAELHLRPLDAAGDRLDARASFDPAAGTLALDVDLEVAADGMIWGLAGLPPGEAPPARLSLAGRGPLAAWQGDLGVEAGGIGRLDGTVTVGVRDGRPLALGLDVEAVPDAGLLPPELAGLAKTIGIRLEATLDNEGERAEIGALELRLGEAGRVRASGAVDFAAGTLAADAEAQLAPALAARLDPGLSWKSAQFRGRAEGPLDAPVLSMDAALEDLGYGGVSAGRLTARLDPEDAAMERFLVVLEGEGADWGEETLDRLLGPAFRLSADGMRAGDLLAIRNLELAAGHLTATGEADVDTAGPRVSGIALDARLERLGELPALADVLAAGGFQASLAKGSWSPEAGLQGDLRFAGRELAFVPEAAAAFVGASPTVTGQVTYDAAGALAVGGLRVETAAAALSGRASLDASAEALGFNLDGTVASGPLKQIAGIEPSEPLQVSLSLSGRPAQPTGDLVLRWQRLTAPGATLGPGQIAAHLAWQDDVPLADLEASVDWRGKQVEAAGRVRAPEHALMLDRLAIETEGMRAAGDLRLPGYALPAAGEVRLEGFDLALLRPFIGQDLAGRVSGTASLAPRDGGQAVEASLQGQGLRYAPPGAPVASVKHLQLDARLRDVLATPAGEAHLTAETIERGEVRVALLRADLSGNLDAAALDFRVEGGSPSGEAEGHLELARGDAGRRLTLGTFQGNVAGRAFSLIGPATLVLPDAGGLRLRAALRAEDGRLRVGYETGGRRTVADIEIERFPLAILPALSGQAVAAGRLDLSAHVEEPSDGEVTGQFRTRVTELALATARDLPPLSAEAEASLGRGILDARIDVRLAAVQEARAEARLPVDVSLADNRFAVAEQGPLEGEAALRGTLQDVWGYLPFPTHKLQGRLDATAQLGGTVAAPALTGRIALDGGRYESLEWGTLLQDITVDARFTDRRLVIDRATANDGRDGTASVSGEAVFGGAEGARYDFATQARDLMVVRRDDISARASADLDFKGAGTGGTLAGKVTVTGAEIDLNAALPPSVPTLEVTRANGTAPAGGARPEEKDEAAGNEILLDIAVDIPGQVFARGRRIDSEWEGKLQIKGTASQPKIFGTFGVKRGTMGLLSRDLVLDETEITFQGRVPANPDLGVHAVYDADDIQAVIRVEGTAQQPKFNITSSPPLPRDEILARMLFGKSRGKLSAIEAAQLAAALNELRGGGGADVLGTVRNFVGLDRLSVGTTEEGEAELEAGRYVTDRVYVGAKQGTTPGTAGVEVEVEVTPNITVTTETGQTGESNVGVNFMWDY